MTKLPTVCHEEVRKNLPSLRPCNQRPISYVSLLITICSVSLIILFTFVFLCFSETNELEEEEDPPEITAEDAIR